MVKSTVENHCPFGAPKDPLIPPFGGGGTTQDQIVYMAVLPPIAIQVLCDCNRNIDCV